MRKSPYENHFAKVQHGVFGASMDVELVNSGSFTVILEDF